jgi:hypothetical protein
MYTRTGKYVFFAQPKAGGISAAMVAVQPHASVEDWRSFNWFRKDGKTAPAGPAG